MNITKDEKFLKRLECLISHGISIMSICEFTGMEPEEIAKYICLVWSKKNNNIEKLYRGFYTAGNQNPPASMNYQYLLENQGIKIKEKIMTN